MTVEMVQEADSLLGASTKVVHAMREEEDDSLRNMLDALAGEKGYEVRVYRSEPKKWNTPPVNITGHLETFSEMPSEEEMKLAFGGGAYQLKVFRPNAKGSLEYFRQVTVKLPGKPHGEGIDTVEPTVMDYGSPPEDSGAVGQAMSMAHQLVEDLRKDNANNGGMDMAAMTALVTTMMAPMQAQVVAAQTQVAEAQKLAADKDARMLELVNKKPDTSVEEKFFHNMIDADGGRRDHARDMHESELRIMRENARDDIKRLEGRQHDALQAQEKAQQREIDNLTRSHDQTISTIKISYDSIITSLKSDITRGERDLTKSDTELVSLRAVKEKTVIEQLSDITAIKDAFSTIGGSDEPDDRKWYEKLAEASLGNPEKLGAIFNIVTGQGNPAQQQQQPPPQITQQAQSQAQPPAQEQQQQYATIDDIPIGVPFQGDDGQVHVKVPPDGSIVLYDHAKALAEEAQQNEGVDKPSPAEVKIAINFMENAFEAGQEPATFAMSAKSMIPGSILKYMESVGIDKFLNEVANLDSNSPLRNQAGRTFIREVAKFLLEGVTV